MPVMLSCLFIAALLSPTGKGLTSWLLYVIFLVFLHFQRGVVSQMWYLIVSIPDLCLPYFYHAMGQISVYGLRMCMNMCGNCGNTS